MFVCESQVTPIRFTPDARQAYPRFGAVILAVIFAIGGAISPAGAKGGAPALPAIGITSAQAATGTVPVPQPRALPVPLVAPSTHGFTITGFIQRAFVSDGKPGSPTSDCRDLPAVQQGGSVLVNGVTVVIPCNSIVQMPAATYSWAEAFDETKYTARLALSGEASSSNSGPGSVNSGPDGESVAKFRYPSNEITINGNLVNGRYIAGLVYISQEKLNLGQGIITGFDYAKGVIFVDNHARLQLNDPMIGAPIVGGRFSAGQSPDGRFSVDNQNPTIKAATGYPMCIPRVDPAVGDDPRCPKKNRPLTASGCRNFRSAGIVFPVAREMTPSTGTFCSGFVMKAPPGSAAQFADVAAVNEADSREQAPFQIGDFISYSGTLLRGDSAGPGGSDTISIHTITANLGIFTQPGSLPVYLALGEFTVSADAPTSFNGVPQEAANRIVVEGSVTDVFSIVDIYLVDLDPATGQESQRWITPATMTGGVGAVGATGIYIDGGITTQRDGPLPGRVRLRATRATPGILISPTRYLRMVARSLCDPSNINATAPLVGGGGQINVSCLRRAPAANGLYSGQYLAPNFNFIFPENLVPGDPIVPNNFWALGFLVLGEGPGTGPLIPQPW